jgi:hypothetical protein
MTALVVTPPMFRFKPARAKKPSVFIGGSIEMGSAPDWQAPMIEALMPVASVIYNPRRPDWNPDWDQKIDHPEFNVQVNWEMDMIEKADMVVFYFAPGTKSPITLLELGFVAGFRRYASHVCCPEGFWRKGNVDIVCERNSIETYPSLDTFTSAIVAECLKYPAR